MVVEVLKRNVVCHREVLETSDIQRLQTGVDNLYCCVSQKYGQTPGINNLVFQVLRQGELSPLADFFMGLVIFPCYILLHVQIYM